MSMNTLMIDRSARKQCLWTRAAQRGKGGMSVSSGQRLKEEVGGGKAATAMTRRNEIRIRIRSRMAAPQADGHGRVRIGAGSCALPSAVLI